MATLRTSMMVAPADSNRHAMEMASTARKTELILFPGPIDTTVEKKYRGQMLMQIASPTITRFPTCSGDQGRMGKCFGCVLDEGGRDL